ncbi:hypothetical protein AOQ88_01815 [Candidatus Riesia sp. GBBU]|nr:hypothetical protein AOQ88_01815 [Candidatus Riesia sp. GBBU]
MFLKKKNHFHFVGICGIGMSGIATVLKKMGYQVSGSDISSNYISKKLSEIGVKIFFNHKKSNIKNSDVVVISSAIPKNNIEIVTANSLKIPVILRAKLLSELMNSKQFNITVAGTHGKTTTTSMIIDIFLKNKLDPTFINGGVLKTINKSCHYGFGKHFIAEADESDASFLYLKPNLSVVTNIGSDHIMTYKNSIRKMKFSFLKFLNNLSDPGTVILCLDDYIARSILKKINKKVLTYGFNDNSNFRITKYKQNKEIISFIITKKNKNIIKCKIKYPGRHNALNATAAIITSLEIGLSKNDILKSLKKFSGVKRRFEIFKRISFENKENITIIDDYGHHPKEIGCTISTVMKWKKRIVLIFQPHRYTRIKCFYEDFIKVLEKVDVLFIMDIYPAWENPLDGINSLSLFNSIYKRKKMKKVFLVNEKNMKKILSYVLRENDLILIQGAGNVSEVVRNIFGI